MLGAPGPELIASGLLGGPTCPALPPGAEKHVFRVLEMIDGTDGSKRLVVEFKTGSGSGVVTITVDALGSLDLQTVLQGQSLGEG